MSVDSASFRRALGQFATGVTVVTTRDAAGHPLGLTVSAFCSVSLHPPLVLVCVDHRSEANAGMRESGLFAVNVLAEEQEDVSRRFAAPGRAKLEGFAFVEGKLRPAARARGARPRGVPRALVPRRGRPRGLGGRGALALRPPGAARSCTTRAPTGRSTGARGVASPAAIEL